MQLTGSAAVRSDQSWKFHHRTKVFPLVDFRTQFYDRYVSAFKSSTSLLNDHALGRYHAWCDHKFGPLIEGMARDSRVLEVGCGPGYLLSWLLKLGFSSVEGIDVSAEQIEVAVERGTNARVADVFDCLKTKHSYDLIIAIDFFEHFSREELLLLCESLSNALAPGGTLLIQTPNGAGLLPGKIITGDITHMTILSPGSLAQLLQCYPFEQIEFRESGPVPVGLKGRIRILAWRAITFVASWIRRIETGRSHEIWTENMICSCRKSQ